MLSFSASTCRVTCGCFSSWWLLASLARCLCRRHHRFASIWCSFVFSISNTLHNQKSIMECHSLISFQVLQLLHSVTCSSSHIPLTMMVPFSPFSTIYADEILIHFITCSCSYLFVALWPHAYFQQLAETHSNGNANSINIRPTEFEDEPDDHGDIVLRDTSPILESMESGRRPWRSMPLWVCPRCPSNSGSVMSFVVSSCSRPT